MTGQEYELACVEYLEEKGFEDITVTQASGDQGIDIIAVKEEVVYGIQCKYYTGTVGNSAVQEAFAGAKFYDCHVAVVMTNSTFTESAKQLAKKNKVLLWAEVVTPLERRQEKEQRERKLQEQRKVEEKKIHYEFEKGQKEYIEFCAQQLKKVAFSKVLVNTNLEKKDVDIIATKNNLKYGIKCFYVLNGKGPFLLDICVIQEDVSGCNKHDLDIPMVISNVPFSQEAISYAKEKSVIIKYSGLRNGIFEE